MNRPADVALLELCLTLQGFTYRFTDERALHDGISQALALSRIAHRREVVAGPNRYDFLCEGGIVIEVKVAGSYQQALAQVDRYAADPQVSGILLATTRSGWPCLMEDLRGKPVLVKRLRRQALG